MTEEYKGVEGEDGARRSRGPLRELEDYLNTLEDIVGRHPEDVSRSLAPYQGDLRQLKQYLQRAITLLDKSEADREAELPADIIGAATAALALMHPGAEVARIRFASRADRVKALRVLEESGGYNRYKDRIVGVSSKYQLERLRERGIPFEMVE